MANEFEDIVYREMGFEKIVGKNLILAEDSKITGSSKICIEEDSHEGVKMILKKDAQDNIKEIKFVCNCGETKSVILDYNEE